MSIVEDADNQEQSARQQILAKDTSAIAIAEGAEPEREYVYAFPRTNP
jgi:hypothetical protein